MSDEVRISKLEAQLEALQAKHADLQTKHTAALATNTTLQEQVDALPELHKRVAELEPLQGKLQEQQTLARSLQAAREFEKMADELGIDPKFRDAVYKLGAYAPEGDEVDPKHLKDHFAKFMASDGAPFKKGGGKEPEKLPAGEGSSRGGRSPGFGDGDAKERVTRAQLMDPDFSTRHVDLLADPSKYEIVEA